VRHLGRVLTFVRRTLGSGSRCEAEDVAQEVFLRVWAAAPRWRDSARFTTWLYRVATNVCLDHVAKRRELACGELPDLADPAPGPSGALHDKQLARHVRQALAELPETQRLAVTLCHYQGLRNGEAAEVMGVSIEALESLLARARRTIGARLRPLAKSLRDEA
jgi:RNA polymerase sigma-70 factor (ECF subfamily)